MAYGAKWQTALRNNNPGLFEKWKEGEEITVYRICELKNNKLHTLFHGLNGSRELPMNVWIYADVKPVRDASKDKGKEYISGFHCMKNLDEMRNFKRMFRKPRDLVLVECKAKEKLLRKKEHSRANVLLADQIKLVRIVEKLEIKTE